jgi:hypothetical protein
MTVVEDFHRPAFRGFYSVAGRFLFVGCDEQHLAELIENLFAAWLLIPAEFSGQPSDVNIHFHGRETLPTIPAGLEQFEIANGGQCYTDGQAYFLDLSNSLLVLNQSNATNVGVWLKTLPATADAELGRVASFAVSAGLRRCGLFELHSAGVVHPESDSGVLIIGPSGSGKSTLTLQLAAAGWRYLSDDELFLSVVDGKVEARGFRNFFAVTQKAMAASGIGSIGNSNVRGAEKTCFEPKSLFPVTQVESAIPRRLLFTSISGENESRLARLSQAETMQRLIKHCPWATYDKAVAAENLDLLSRLARQSQAFDLFAGHDLLSPNRASDLLISQTGLN